MKNFNVKVQHDTGVVKLRIKAISKESAIKMVMTSEKCPKSAIIRVRELINKSYI